MNDVILLLIGAFIGALMTIGFYKDKVKELRDINDYAWGVIANAWEGWNDKHNSNKNYREWVESAIRWRNKYTESIKNVKF